MDNALIIPPNGAGVFSEKLKSRLFTFYNGGSDDQTAVTFDLTTDGGYADTIKAVSGTPTKTNSGISDGAITIAGDVTLATDSTSGITVKLLAAANDNLGTSVSGQSIDKQPNFKYNTPAIGLIVKYSAIEISGVKGKVKVTLDWGINGKKAANDRYMAMKVGTNNAISQGNVDTSSEEEPTAIEQTALTDTYDFGTTAGSIYIGATNELGIKSVKIESVE